MKHPRQRAARAEWHSVAPLHVLQRRDGSSWARVVTSTARESAQSRRNHSARPGEGISRATPSVGELPADGGQLGDHEGSEQRVRDPEVIDLDHGENHGQHGSDDHHSSAS